jgi:DNA-directed RNA polymerase specialized sigma24 family protein/LysM repeat protein
MDLKPPASNGPTPTHRKGLRNEAFGLADDQPILSSDLDWMLESRQATPAMLAEVLVREYYPEIYRLLLALLDDVPTARRAARRAFADALLDISNYRSADGVKPWLYFHALEVYNRLRRGLILGRAVRAFLPGRGADTQVSPYGSTLDGPYGSTLDSPYAATLDGPYASTQDSHHASPLPRDPSSWQEACMWLAIDALDERSRRAVILSYLCDLPQPLLVGLLQISTARLASLLERAERKLIASLANDGFRLQDLPGQDLKTALRAALHSRTPPVDPVELDLQALIESLGHRAGRQLTRRRAAGALKEIVWVGLAIIVVIGLMYRANLLLPEKRSLPEAARVTPTPTPYLVLQSQLLTFSYMVQLGDTLASIGERLGISPERLAEMNRLATNMSLQPGQNLLIMIPLATPGPSPTQVQPVAHRLEPLSEHSSDVDIRNYLSLSETLWNTLWLDAIDTQYGPAGYIGPTQDLRYQAYLSHDEQRLELNMDLSGRLASVVLTSGGLQYGVTSYSGSAYVESAQPANFFRSRWDTMIFPSHSSWLENEGAFQVLGSAEVAGRKTVVVEWRRTRPGEEDYPPRRLRLWIDAVIGVILRLQHYGGSETNTLLEDLIVTELMVDVDFPRSSLYDPHTLRDVSPVPYLPGASANANRQGSHPPLGLPTGHEHLDQLTPPAGFNAADKPLIFQYPQGSSKPEQVRGVYNVELFAGGYHLNTLEMPDPWTIRCDRSPDGKRLAFVDGSESFAQRTQFTWLSLAPPYQLNFPNLDIEPHSFAFAPDSHRMAVFGLIKGGGGLVGGLYVVDLNSGATKKLEEMWLAESLVWSPDGRYLSLVAWQENWYQPQVQVIDVNKRQVVYRTPIDYHSLWIRDYPAWPASDWPGHAWGVKFPQLRIGLEGCARAPQN